MYVCGGSAAAGQMAKCLAWRRATGLALPSTWHPKCTCFIRKATKRSNREPTALMSRNVTTTNHSTQRDVYMMSHAIQNEFIDIVSLNHTHTHIHTYTHTHIHTHAYIQHAYSIQHTYTYIQHTYTCSVHTFIHSYMYTQYICTYMHTMCDWIEGLV